MKNQKYDLNRRLLEVSERGDVELIKLALKNGADPNCHNNACLSLASLSGNLDAVKMLESAGADVTANDSEALFWACEGNHYDIAEYLINAGSAVPGDVLEYAIANRNHNLIKLFLNAGETDYSDSIKWLQDQENIKIENAAQFRLYVSLDFSRFPGSGSITNHFTGEKVTLSPPQLALYEHILEKDVFILENIGYLRSEQIHDLLEGRRIFFNNWPGEYKKLLLLTLKIFD